jgi:hypothetical protein
LHLRAECNEVGAEEAECSDGASVEGFDELREDKGGENIHWGWGG